MTAVTNDELDYEITEEPEEDEALPPSVYEIFSYPADTTLRGYLDQWDNGQLFVPPFQRNYVWDQTRASKLIESFLVGLPVPPVFLYKPAATKSFWIIDGHQRIRSIVDFQKGIFNESRFRLKGVDARWLSKTYADFSESEQFSFQTTVLRAIVIQQTNPKDHSSIYKIFERLNTGGLRLNAMEVRQCVFESRLLSRLKEINKMSDWRDLIGMQKADKRLKDVELLLRIISLYRALDAYEKPMKGFLNDCALHFKLSEERGDFSEEDGVLANLTSTITAVRSQLGNRPFHLRGRLNYSALDAIVVAAMRKGTAENLKNRYENLLSNEEFLNSASYDTSDESVLKKRFRLAFEAFENK